MDQQSNSAAAASSPLAQYTAAIDTVSQAGLSVGFSARVLDAAFRKHDLEVVRQVRRDIEALSVMLATENRQDTALASHKARSVMASILRDLFGYPFRPITINPSWLTSTVHSLASGIYEERAFDRLPILADALQDAGCDHEDILNHCRQPGEHVRGCWCVDLLLGKS